MNINKLLQLLAKLKEYRTTLQNAYLKLKQAIAKLIASLRTSK